MDKEALQMLNMFMTATQMAKSRNTFEFHYNVQRASLLELFKKAFPYLQNDANLVNIVDMAMRG